MSDGRSQMIEVAPAAASPAGGDDAPAKAFARGKGDAEFYTARLRACEFFARLPVRLAL